MTRGIFRGANGRKRSGAELKKPGAAADGADYHHRWMRALERLMEGKGVAVPGEIDTVTAAWHRAAHATPHGKPILLDNDPERGWT